MTIRDHYVIVTVSPEEVQFELESILATLSGVPVLGVFVRALTAPPPERQREALFTTLEERLSRVQSGIRDIEGCEAMTVTQATAHRSSASSGPARRRGVDSEILRT